MSDAAFLAFGSHRREDGVDENPYRAPAGDRDSNAPIPNASKRQPPKALLWLLLLLFPVAHLASLKLGAYGRVPVIAFGCFFVFTLYRWIFHLRA